MGPPHWHFPAAWTQTPLSAARPRGQVCLSLSLQFEGGRSTQEIRKFWQNYEHPSINKQEWSEQEVAQLKAVAAKHGHLDWQRIAEELGVRVTPRPGPALGAASGSALATREGGWRRSEAARTTPPPADAPEQPRCSARSVPFPSLTSCSGVCSGGLGRLYPVPLVLFLLVS